MDLLNMLLGSLTSNSSLSALAGKTGASVAQLSSLIKMALPILLKFLTQNAASAGGAQSLLTALKGHDVKKSMTEQIEEADQEDGAKIIHHILGNDSEKVVDALAQETKLNAGQVNSALSSIAPGLMSGLLAATNSAAKVDLSDGLDFSDLAALFGGAVGGGASMLSSAGSLLGGFLGGGNSGGAGSLLGSLLGGAPAQSQPQQSSSGLLGSLLGGAGGLLGGLFGGSDSQKPQQAQQTINENAFNGMDLLGTLTALLK